MMPIKWNVVAILNVFDRCERGVPPVAYKLGDKGQFLYLFVLKDFSLLMIVLHVDRKMQYDLNWTEHHNNSCRELPRGIQELRQ